MLKHRLLTAGCLIPPLLAGLLLLPTPAIAVVFAVFAGIGAWEWASLAGWSEPSSRVLYCLVIGGCLWPTYTLLRLPWDAAGLFGVSALLLSWWGLCGYWLFDYQRKGLGIPRSRPLLTMAGLLVVVPAWAAIVRLHGAIDARGYLVVLLLLIVWSADTGAFFVGRRYGRHRLADRVSPGKTWEGLIGGLLAGASVALLCSAPLALRPRERLLFVFVCVVTVLFSVLGDLFESLVKRQAGVKDSGRLLPGHGGLLDRIDSLTAAAPVFALGMVAVGVPL
jgi:phosphatidate cytidylyltransferase